MPLHDDPLDELRLLLLERLGSIRHGDPEIHDVLSALNYLEMPEPTDVTRRGGFDDLPVFFPG
jgi:hypothetical protein